MNASLEKEIKTVSHIRWISCLQKNSCHSTLWPNFLMPRNADQAESLCQGRQNRSASAVGRSSRECPRAAEAVWLDGAEFCLARSCPAGGGGPRSPCWGTESTAPPHWGFLSSAQVALGDHLEIQPPTAYLAFPLFTAVAFSGFNRNLLKLWYSRVSRRLLYSLFYLILKVKKPVKTYSCVEINDGISCKLVLCMYLSTQCF